MCVECAEAEESRQPHHPRTSLKLFIMVARSIRLTWAQNMPFTVVLKDTFREIDMHGRNSHGGFAQLQTWHGKCSSHDTILNFDTPT